MAPIPEIAHHEAAHPVGRGPRKVRGAGAGTSTATAMGPMDPESWNSEPNRIGGKKLDRHEKLTRIELALAEIDTTGKTNMSERDRQALKEAVAELLPKQSRREKQEQKSSTILRPGCARSYTGPNTQTSPRSNSSSVTMS